MPTTPVTLTHLNQLADLHDAVGTTRALASASLASPTAQPAVSLDLTPILRALLPLLPLLKPVLKQLILDNLDSWLDLLLAAITKALTPPPASTPPPAV